MEQKARSIVLIIVGIIAIGLSIKCYSIDDLDYETNSYYGGDAYTGIQNAAATTSKNVKDLAGIVQFGFGSILLVMGLTLVGVGLTTPVGKREDIAVSSPEVKEEAPIVETPVEVPVESPSEEKDKAEAEA